MKSHTYNSASKSIITITLSLFCALTFAQTTGLRLTATASYDIVSGVMHQTDSTKYNWLGNFGGDQDHANQTLYYTFREDINSNYSSINYAYRYLTTYNTNNQQLTFTELSWDGSIYQYNSRITYTYDSLGRNDTRLTERFTAGVWQNNGYETDSFDVANHVVSTNILQWSVVNNNWGPSAIITQNYDAAGNRTLYRLIEWNGTSWINYGQNTYTYDANNNRLTETSYNGNDTLWIPASRWAFQYDQNNNETLYSYYNWNTGTSTWTPIWRDIFNYGANNLQSDWTDQTYSGGNYVNSFKYSFTYNAANLKETTLRQNWDGTTFINNQKTLDTYNTDGFTTEEKNQYWDGTAWVDTTRSTWIRNGNDQSLVKTDDADVIGAWTTKSQKFFYYEEYTPTGVKEIENENVNINAYPNPFTVNTLLNFEQPESSEATITIFNQQGQIVKTEKAWYPTGRNNWLWNGDNQSGTEVSNGIYFIRILSGGQTSTSKVIKMK